MSDQPMTPAPDPADQFSDDSDDAVDDDRFLAGVLVLDFTQYLAGPACTRLMVELGAEVIKVEAAPAGDPTRTRVPQVDGRAGLFVQQNRGKKSLAVDLRHPQGVALVKDLVRHVDVVVENATPGVMERKGLGYADLAAVNPGIVMASISGFGQWGPRRRSRATGACPCGPGATTSRRPRPARSANRDELTAIVEAWLATFPSADATVSALAAAGVPAGKVMSPADAVDDPHLVARGTVREIHDPFIGTFQAPGFPIKFDGRPVEPDLVARPGPAQRRGAGRPARVVGRHRRRHRRRCPDRTRPLNRRPRRLRSGRVPDPREAAGRGTGRRADPNRQPLPRSARARIR